MGDQMRVTVIAAPSADRSAESERFFAVGDVYEVVRDAARGKVPDGWLVLAYTTW